MGYRNIFLIYIQKLTTNDERLRTVLIECGKVLEKVLMKYENFHVIRLYHSKDLDEDGSESFVFNVGIKDIPWDMKMKIWDELAITRNKLKDLVSQGLIYNKSPINRTIRIIEKIRINMVI
ncbi:MAG: hypothetical protein ACP5RS_05685 [Thermoplasmata archaeon]